MEQWVGLIDCNNFFVSCERLFRPDLQGKPVLVLSSNDGCVIARSQEVKDMGVPMGVPYFQIKDIIKDKTVTLFSTHFTLYRDISRRVFEVVRSELDSVEQYSVDEAFFYIKGDIEIITTQVRFVKDKVERETGIPVSIGVAPSKTIAKYASKLAKKTGGLKVLTLDEWHSQSSQITLESLWGVGARTAQVFRERSLLSVKDLAQLEERQVRANFGITGVRLWYEINGRPAIVLSKRGSEGQKSILHSRSFKDTTTDLSVLKDAVAYHVREAAKDLRELGFRAGIIQVYVGTSRHGDFFLKGGSKQEILTVPTDDTFTLLRIAESVVDALYQPDVPYKKVGVLLSDFIPEAHASQSLFEDEKETRTAALSHVIDKINNQLPHTARLLVGSRLKQEMWQASRVHRSPAYTTSWEDIATVKA